MNMLTKQILSARAHLRELKKISPYMFPEYNRLKEAERTFELAQKELEEARQAWKQLAN